MVYQIKIKNILNRSCIRERSKDGLQKLGEKKRQIVYMLPNVIILN